MPDLPHPIYGKAYDRAGSILPNTDITLTNVRTGDIVTETTDSEGQFSMNCANFTNGYDDGDEVYVSIATEPTWEFYLTPTANKTYPNWLRITDLADGITPSHSQIRVKIDSTNYPRSRTDLTIQRGS